MSKYKYPSDVLPFMRARLALSLFHVQDSGHDLAKLVGDEEIKCTSAVDRLDINLQKARKYLHEAVNDIGNMLAD